MSTNILAMPLVDMTVTTGTNEDWIASLKYTQDDETTPLDLSGIALRMEVRRNVDDEEVAVEGSTTDGRVSIGGTGNAYVLINVPVTAMNNLLTEGTYVGDIVATADGYTRVIVRIVATIVKGVTR